MQTSTSTGSMVSSQKRAMPIVRMSQRVAKEDLKERLKTQWEFLLLTSAFMAAVSVTFLASEEPANNTNRRLWNAFLTVNAVAFLLLLTAAVNLMCFLTTLMMCPTEDVKIVVTKLKHLEPVPSGMLMFAVVLLICSMPMYMSIRIGHDSAATIGISVLAGTCIIFLVFLFGYCSLRIQDQLLRTNDQLSTQQPSA